MEALNFEKLTAATVVCGLLVIIVRWLLGSFAERLKAIETAVNEVNDAVNHADKRGPDAMKLYDMVMDAHRRGKATADQVSELVDWKRSYENGPMDTGVKVIEYVEGTSKKLDELGAKVDQCKERIEAVGCPVRLEQAEQCLKEIRGHFSDKDNEGNNQAKPEE